MNLLDIDSATALPSPEWDAVLAEKVMGWEWEPAPYGLRIGLAPEQLQVGTWRTPVGFRNEWSPTTNPAHAGELRRMAEASDCYHSPVIGPGCFVHVDGFCGKCLYSETNGDKDKAEALAICRAVTAAIQQEGGD